MNFKHTILVVIGLLSVTACGRSSSAAADNAMAQAPAEVKVDFSADSAFSYVARQVDFGPRVPNSEAHRQCGDWLVEKLNEFGADTVAQQRVQLRAWDGTTLNARNISASFNSDAQKRILLLSHWDSRPWADNDPDPSRHDQPIDGANDGASGVGIILEIARNLSLKSPSVGVDVLFVDAEDYGTRSDIDGVEDDEASWCLGTQYWVSNPTVDLTKIRYAILLDMVGGKDAKFSKEYFSKRYCASTVDKVWQCAQRSGYGSRFVDDRAMPIIDDHLPLLKAGVQAIDIIEMNHPDTGSFNPTWHTHADNIDNIDPATLKAVGQTLTNLIYNE